ncbi:MAG: hypothetical protein IKZ48_06700 [Prevotella sp.]|nr:hypothetical protein [Prevotella sp.]
MNQSNEQSVFHVRSSRAVIINGYKLYMNNFRTIFRHTWPFAIVYSIVIAMMMYAFLHSLPQLMTATKLAQQGVMTNDLRTFQAFMYPLLLVIMLINILLASPVFKLFSEYQQSGVIAPPTKWYRVGAWPMMLCMLRLLLWFILLDIIVSMAIGIIFGIGAVLLMVTGINIGNAMITIGVASILVSIIVMAMLLPLVYTTFKYLLTPRSSFVNILTHTYSVGLRHWGSLFLVMFMVAIINAIISTVIMLPYNILTAAITTSLAGVANGDPIGMPDYMGWMSFIVFCLAGFVLAYLTLSTLFPLYYLYGSIEKQEEERRELSIEK